MPAYDPPPAETATACTTGAANATEDGGASAGPTPGRAAAEAGPKKNENGAVNTWS